MIAAELPPPVTLVQMMNGWGRNVTTPTIEQIRSHGSVRQYRPDPVSPELVETIVAAAQRSSTSFNLQNYSVVAVTGAAKRARLAQLCGEQTHIAQAPVFLAWCADLARLDRVCQLRGYTQITAYVENFLVSAVDVAIVMQSAALAAESLGLGMCYIGAIRNRPADIIEVLELPRLVFPIAGMTLGWPLQVPAQRPRLPLTTVLYWEHYERSPENAALLDYDQAMIETGIYEGRQVPVPGVEGEMKDYGWMEHSARRASRAVGSELSQVLERQGFDLK